MVVVGVTGGIAAYKSVTLVRLLRKAGIEVHVIPTPAALEMVGCTTWEAISANPVFSRTNDAAEQVTHVRFAQNADLIVIAPATANTLAKICAGIADNLLCNTVLAAKCPILLAPAMHSEMWLNPATVENVSVLARRGFDFVGPESGRLTGTDSGIGRMSEPETIFARVLEMLEATSTAYFSSEKKCVPSIERNFPSVEKNVRNLLKNRHLVISGGGTHEPIDPVRFIGNHSTGTMSVALAKSFQQLGAKVSLVGANIAANVLDSISLQVTAGGIEYIPVATAAEMRDAMIRLAASADAVIMAAAVADYRVKAETLTKIKRENQELTLQLTANPDILRELVRTRQTRKKQVIVGFAAETGSETKDFRQLGIEKAVRKGADLLAINQVSKNSGFGDVATTLFIVDSTGNEKAVITGQKAEVADQLALLISAEILHC